MECTRRRRDLQVGFPVPERNLVWKCLQRDNLLCARNTRFGDPGGMCEVEREFGRLRRAVCFVPLVLQWSGDARWFQRLIGTLQTVLSCLVGIPWWRARTAKHNKVKLSPSSCSLPKDKSQRRWMDQEWKQEKEEMEEADRRAALCLRNGGKWSA